MALLRQRVLEAMIDPYECSGWCASTILSKKNNNKVVVH